MASVGDFSPVNPGETKTFSIDFAAQLAAGDSIVSCSGSVAAYFGTDANAATIALAPASKSGSVVLQSLGGVSQGFQAGVVYRWTATAVTANGMTLINYGHIACQSIA